MKSKTNITNSGRQRKVELPHPKGTSSQRLFLSCPYNRRPMTVDDEIKNIEWQCKEIRKIGKEIQAIFDSMNKED